MQPGWISSDSVTVGEFCDSLPEDPPSPPQPPGASAELSWRTPTWANRTRPGKVTSPSHRQTQQSAPARAASWPRRLSPTTTCRPISTSRMALV